MIIDKYKIELELASKGLLLLDLCEMSNVAKATLSLALRNRRNCRPKTVGKIAKALGVPIENIIVKEGD